MGPLGIQERDHRRPARRGGGGADFSPRSGTSERTPGD
jgi:hypothetical protein